jgi:hypothetical protein
MNKESWVDEPVQAPPINQGSAPFGVLVGLFEKLSNERKLERRKKLLNSWFGVRIIYSCFRLLSTFSLAALERREGS